MSSIKTVNNEKNYLNRPRLINKNKDDFKSELLDYASKNFKNQISDFSEASLGGMLLDFAAIVGESLAYYIDSQIDELDYETATSDFSVINHLRKANVKSGFASPSSCYVDFFAMIPVDANNEVLQEYLPVILKETNLESDTGINFILQEDVDFRENYKNLETQNISIDGGEQVTHKILSKKGLCVSGQIVSESFTFDNENTSSFLSYVFSNENITKIISVKDVTSDRNEYKEVEFLSQDTVYDKVILGKDSFYNVKPAPFRYVIEKSFDDGLTTIRFGNGENNILEDGLFTNPEEISLPLLGRDYLNNYSLDPKRLINSPSLGVSPAGKTLVAKYKFGGGLSHNVPARSISQINSIQYKFPNLENTQDFRVSAVLSSISVLNNEKSVGGSDALTLEELKQKIPESLKMQSRIVNHEDLLARIYTMPVDFGRIHKVAILDNHYSKVAKDLFVLCKDINGFYEPANDAIKQNLSNYINEYRLIGDVFNIVDVDVYNIGIALKVKTAPNYEIQAVLSSIKSRIFSTMRFETLQIGQGLNVNNIISIALQTPGVLTVSSNYETIVYSKNNFEIDNNQAISDEKVYSDNIFSSRQMYEDGIIYPPRGGIFELKYNSDIEIING